MKGNKFCSLGDGIKFYVMSSWLNYNTWMCSMFIKMCSLHLINFVFYLEDFQVTVNLDVFDIPRCDSNRLLHSFGDFDVKCASRSPKIALSAEIGVIAAVYISTLHSKGSLAMLCWPEFLLPYVSLLSSYLPRYFTCSDWFNTSLNLKGKHVRFFDVKVTWLHFISFAFILQWANNCSTSSMWFSTSRDATTGLKYAQSINIYSAKVEVNRR